MDLGESLNPGIDIGQIEGGFMQGYGLFVMEQLIHSPTGSLLTKGEIVGIFLFSPGDFTAGWQVLELTKFPVSTMFHPSSMFVCCAA